MKEPPTPFGKAVYTAIKVLNMCGALLSFVCFKLLLISPFLLGVIVGRWLGYPPLTTSAWIGWGLIILCPLCCDALEKVARERQQSHPTFVGAS